MASHEKCIRRRDDAARATDQTPVVLLSGDIGNRLFDKLKEAARPFFNCGVAEANMMGVAAGMAHVGPAPGRLHDHALHHDALLEQIRVDVCYHNVPVIIVGVGAGLSYACLGPHASFAARTSRFLRCCPTWCVLCPGDALEVRGAAQAPPCSMTGPVYIRIGKKGEPVIHAIGAESRRRRQPAGHARRRRCLPTRGRQSAAGSA